MAIAPGTPGTGDYAGQVWGLTTDGMGNQIYGWDDPNSHVPVGSKAVGDGFGGGMQAPAPASGPGPMAGAMAGLGAAGGGAGVGAVGAGSDPIASTPPTTPDTGLGASSASGSQQLSAPTNGRQGIGQRIFPALQALLGSPAY